MRDNRFVVGVVAPTGDRKDRATELLKGHGAHTMTYFNKHTIEYVTPPERK